MFAFYLSRLKKIFSIAKKILLVVVVFLTVISLFIYFINQDKPRATYDPIKKNREEIYKVVNDPKLKKTKEGKLTIALYRAIMCGMVGEACSDNPSDGDKNFDKSVFGFMTNLIVFPYANPPASGVIWAYTGLQNAGFISNAYAAEGIGFAAIKPFAGLWKIFRDFSYMLLVLVLIAIGFMIMFRMKINPQTVISVEAALPKIVLALLLITFSFPIAGFLIDMMYIIMAVAINILSDAGKNFPAYEFQNKYLTAGPQVLEEAFFPVSFDALIPESLKPLKEFLASIFNLFTAGTFIPVVYSAVNKFLNLVLIGLNIFLILPSLIRVFLELLSGVATFIVTHRALSFINDTNVSKAFDNWVGGLVTAVIGWGKLPSGLIGLILAIVIGLIVAFLMLPLILGLLVLFTIILLFFRVFFLLLTTYLRILLLIIFSPIFLLFEAVPGRSAFSYWFKNLFVELLTFPIVVVILLVGYVITNNAVLDIAKGVTFWVPPFLYGFNQFAYTFLIGVGLIFLIPDLVKAVKELLGVKGLPVGIGPGVFFSGVSAPLGGGLGLLGGYGSLAIAMPGLRKFAQKITSGVPFIGGLFEEPGGGGGGGGGGSGGGVGFGRSRSA